MKMPCMYNIRLDSSGSLCHSQDGLSDEKKKEF